MWYGAPAIEISKIPLYSNQYPAWNCLGIIIAGRMYVYPDG